MDSSTTATRDMVNLGEHCRLCRGTGGGYDDNGNGTWAFIACHACRGSGRQTVRVDEAVSA